MNIKYHAKVLLTGFSRTLGGTATATLFGLAAYGFVSIPAEGGYVAVCDFIGSVIVLFFGLLAMYCMGAGKAKRKREEPKKGRFLA